jgi:hypothetical protein
MNKCPRTALVLFSFTSLLLGACSSSSGNKPADVSDAGNTPGVDGAAGSGSPGGTAAGDAGVPSGTGGSYGGGGGGAGGTPSPCQDPMFPVSCPGLNEVPALCWSAGTDCSTLTKCGNDFKSCTSPGAHFDCTQMTCVGPAGMECGQPEFPVSCPGLDDVPKLCWSAGTVCSTISRCGNDFKSCVSPGYRFDCTQQRCVPAPDGGVAQPDAGSPDTAAADAPGASGDAATDAAADALSDAHD